MYVHQGWDGDYILLHTVTQEPVKVNEEYLYHDVKLRCNGGRAPHKPASTGRIYMHNESAGIIHEWFPNVCDMVWSPYRRVT